MAQKQSSNVDAWLTRETDHIRKALESASRHFDGNDNLTVNTLEAVYGRESSFGSPNFMGTRGATGAAGHFRMEAETAKRYRLSITKENDQRFDIYYAPDAAPRYMKDLNRFFGKQTNLGTGFDTIPVHDLSGRKIFVLAAFNAGEGRIARAQRLAEASGKNPELWEDVVKFLKAAKATDDKVIEIREYIENVTSYEDEFSIKSKADKKIKDKEPREEKRCTEGHWRTIDDHPVFICD